MKRQLLLVFGFIFFVFLGYANEFNFQVNVDKSSIVADENVTVSIAVEYPDNFDLDIDFLRNNLIWDNNSSAFVIRSENIDQPIHTGNSITQKINYCLEPWRAGNHYLFPRVRFTGANDKYIYGDPINVIVDLPADETVKTMRSGSLLAIDNRAPIGQQMFIIDEKEPSKEKDQMQQPFMERSVSWMWLVLLIVISTSIIFVRWWLLRNTQSKAALQKSLDPRKKALESLEILQKEKLPEQKRIEEFYVRLTQIERFYIEERFNVKAPEQTTQEFLREIAQNETFDAQKRSLLQNFLNVADLVKFARLEPNIDECHNAIKMARMFINQE